VALWICVLNPLVIIHLMGGVHNEIADGRHDDGRYRTDVRPPSRRRYRLIAVAVAVKATAVLALPFMVWVWMRHLRDDRNHSAARAFVTASAASVAISSRCSPCCPASPVSAWAG